MRPGGTDTDRVVAPIVVLGAPRSGTTLLAGLLGAHPDCVEAREARLVWRYGNDSHSDELEPSMATSRTIDHIHKSFAAIVRNGGGTRLVEKTPANAVRPWFVDTVFPDSLYVHITRNGWGCVPSIRNFWAARGQGMDKKQGRKAVRRIREARPSQFPYYAVELGRRLTGRRLGHVPLYGPRLAGLQETVDELGRLHASALQWEACAQRSHAFGGTVGSTRYFEVKLEDLDDEIFRRIVEFCGLRPDDAQVARFNATFDRAKASGRAPLTDDERRQLTPILEPLNAWLGYS